MTHRSEDGGAAVSAGREALIEIAVTAHARNALWQLQAEYPTGTREDAEADIELARYDMIPVVDAILASDWLAAHAAEIRAQALTVTDEMVKAAKEALGHSGSGQRLMTALDDVELRILAEKATPGPWELRWMLGDENWPVVRAEGFGVIPDVPAGAYVNPADAAYIAAANPSVVLALLARVQTAEAKLAALEAQPEPEWEYGERSAITPGHVWGPWPKDLAAPPGSAVRRRKAGPWEPVPDTRSNT